MTSHILQDMSEAITNDYSNSHQAIDVVASGNQIDDVIAVSDGVVEMVVKDMQYTNHNTYGTATYGNFVKIKHPNGKKTLYAHLKYGSVTVSNGQAVSKGEKIGTMGATGNAYGAHLHFEVRNSNETRENPNNYLNGNKTLDVVKKENNNEEEIEDNQTPLDESIKTEKENTNIEKPTPNKEEINKSSEIINELTPSKVNTSSASKAKTVVLENNNYKGGSIVDGLKEIGFDSSYDNRCIIALKNGIENYHGTYNQNIYLLKLLKQGKLKA